MVTEVLDPPDVGTSVRISQTFATLDLIPVLLDPEIITLKVKDPNAAEIDHSVVRASVGKYYLDLAVGVVGQWRYRWESTNPERAYEGSFVVRSDSFRLYAPPGESVPPNIPGTIFDFSAPTPITPWIIVHNLDRYPSVTLTDLAEHVIEADVEYLDINTVRVDFSAPMAGFAHLE